MANRAHSVITTFVGGSHLGAVNPTRRKAGQITFGRAAAGSSVWVQIIPTPKVEISDAQVACVLSRAVAVIDPLLDVLADTDPLGLKSRTHRDDDATGTVGQVADALAWLLNTADVPGTEAWSGMDTEARTHWWVRRVGALNTVAVAFPGALGVVAARLPLRDLLGFANQAIVLCAVAREAGISTRWEQVRLLASVLCHRELSPLVATDEPVAASPDASGNPLSPLSIGQSLWHLTGLLSAIDGELSRRPQPRALFRYVGLLPAVGAVAAYLGEYGALMRAAKAAQRWITQHP